MQKRKKLLFRALRILVLTPVGILAIIMVFLAALCPGVMAGLQCAADDQL